MNIQQLEYFTSIAETLSYSKSAELLGLSQPALSMSITKLEEELGFALFAKSGRNIILTESGKNYYKTASAVINKLTEGALQAKNLMKSKAGCITVAVPSDMQPSFLSQLFHDFFANYPDIKMNILQKDCLEIFSLLKTNSVDWAIMPLHKWLYEKNNISYEELCTKPVFAVMDNTHKYADREKLFMADLHDQNIVVNSGFGQGKIESVCNSYKIKRLDTDILIVPPASALLEPLLKKDNYLYMTCFVSEKLQKEAHLRIIPLEDASVISEKYVLAWYGRKKDVGVHREFYDHLKKAMQQ